MSFISFRGCLRLFVVWVRGKLRGWDWFIGKERLIFRFVSVGWGFKDG